MKQAYFPSDWKFTLVDGKAPFIYAWQYLPLDYNYAKDTADSCSDRHLGVGLLLGPISDGILAVDFDGIGAMTYFEREVGMSMSDLLATGAVAWTSGDPFNIHTEGRMQIAFKVPFDFWSSVKPLKLLGDNSDGLEFRWSRQQSVIPPSPHPTRMSYKWITAPTAASTNIAIPNKILNFWMRQCLTAPIISSAARRFERASDDKITEIFSALRDKAEQLEYDSWLHVTWAAMRELGTEQGIELMKELYPEQYAGEYDRIANGHDETRSPGIGAVINIVKKIDPTYRPPKAEIVHKSLVNGEDYSSVAINYIEAKCGEGKTHYMLNEIAKRGGIWFYAVDKIDPTIHERVTEFNDAKIAAGRPNFRTFDAHSRTKSEFAVRAQIEAHLSQIETLQIKDAIIFITHAGLFLNDWRKMAPDCNLVIDEVTDISTLSGINMKINYKMAQQYLKADYIDGECYFMKLTDAGEDKLEEGFDDIDNVLEGILTACNQANGGVWIDCESWIKPQSNAVSWFAIKTPSAVQYFKEIWCLADEFSKSAFYKIWREVFKVQFNQVPLPVTRKRLMNLEKRTTIHYFSNDNASFGRFDSDDCLKMIGDYVTNKHGSAYIWSCNKRAKPTMLMHAKGEYVLPKAHGRNDLQHHTVALWLSAMKASGFEYRFMERLCKMTKDELDLARERNAAYQFVMRSALRDFKSTCHVELYVFDKATAEYLSTRMGDATINHITGVVTDIRKKAGRKPIGSVAMTAAERKAKFKSRQKEVAGNEIVQRPDAANPFPNQLKHNSHPLDNYITSNYQENSKTKSKSSNILSAAPGIGALDTYKRLKAKGTK